MAGAYHYHHWGVCDADCPAFPQVLICDCIREDGKPHPDCPGYAKCSQALADAE